MEIISELYSYHEYKRISDLLDVLRKFNIIYSWDADFCKKHGDNELWYQIIIEMEDTNEPRK